MVKLNRIYTRTGDGGTTGLVDGSRLPKHALRMQAVGDVDETNAALGLAAVLAEGELQDDLVRFQNALFDLGADLATPGDDFAPSETVLRIVETQVTHVEVRIDALNSNMEPLTSFVLPGGSELSARLHLARTIARRAERSMTALAESQPVNPTALSYINRLSDWLFVAARVANDGGKGDVTWVPGANR